MKKRTKSRAATGKRRTGRKGVVSFPRSMLEMTFPEFEKAAKRTDVCLLPLSAVEEHGSHLPLMTDSVIVAGQLAEVQAWLKRRRVETVIGPLLHIGITTEADDWSRDGTYTYPGSLTVAADTFVALYLDVIRSLASHGLKRFFLYSGHYGPRHLKIMARVAEEANAKAGGTRTWAVLHSENAERLGLAGAGHVLSIRQGRNFDLLERKLGRGGERATSTHADGAEVSEMLLLRPDLVRRGYSRLAEAPSSRFFAAYRSGKKEENPSGMGGFPFARASAEAGRAIQKYRARAIGEAVLEALGR